MHADNRFEDIDRDATKWGNAAVELSGQCATIEEICAASNEKMPRTEDDLAYLRIKCRAWGIACYLDGEKVWEEARRDRDAVSKARHD